MKRSLRLLIILFLICGYSIDYPQNKQVFVGPAPVTRAGDDAVINMTVRLNPASIAYGHLYQSGSTLSMPIPAGYPFNTMSLFQPPEFASSMTKGGDGNYYLITHEPALYDFNSTTGMVTLIGSIYGLNDLPNGISYNPANGGYYIITSLSLFSFDITTRVATLIGEMGVNNSAFIDLCFTDGGACYAYDIATDAGYIIDPSTAAATYLGPLGYVANYGQGMSYDMETGTIYLSAYNLGTSTGQLRTMDPGTGYTTLIVDWGNQEIAPFAINTQYPSPCTLEAPSDPNPSDGTTGLLVSGVTLSWTNGSGTEGVELWFGSVGHVIKVYDGPAISTYDLPALEYNKNYLWWVVCKSSACKTQGLPWSFTTRQDTNLVAVFYEPFNNGNCWTPIGPLGQQNWSISNTNNAGGSPPELDLFYNPTFYGTSDIISCSISSSNLYQNFVSFKHYYDQFLGAGPTIGLAVTYDDGATSDVLWEESPVGDVVGEQVGFNFIPDSSNYQLIFYFTGNSYVINQWDIDDLEIYYVVPVELTSFTANLLDNKVELNWTTATETNNKGFEIQRGTGRSFETIGFVDGHGTTTQTQKYSYLDNNVKSGKYTYRLRQIDFDGTFKFSNSIEIEVPVLKEYSLNQNYPNPFNPSTIISFNLTVDSKISLKVFDILGQEVTTLIDGNQTAGEHEISFNASNLNSGVYIYKIEATGIDGSRFVNVRKMLLMK